MIIGTKLGFAIEFKLDNEFGGVWMYGKFCFWINNQCIGDYDSGTSLRDVLFQMKNIIRDNGNRRNDVLFILGKDELFYRLNSALYGCEESPYFNIANDETWSRFNIKITVDVFDGLKIFLVENQEKARIIFKYLRENEEGEIKEFSLESGEFDSIALRAYKKLERLYNIELDKESNANS